MTWWMALFGGPTPKRHVAYSNSPEIQRLDLGRLRGWTKMLKEEKAQGIHRVKTVQKYHDKNGKLRYKGAEGLKPSESET